MNNEPTREQQRVIDHAGNIVVTAKPGSGKTFTIVEKISKIMPTLPDYKGIIAISFTNKASNELKQRCRRQCEDTKQSFFGTIDKFYISQIIIPFACHITGRVSDYEIISNPSDYDKYSPLFNAKDLPSDRENELLIAGLHDGKIFLKHTGKTALYILENIPGAIEYIKARFTHIIVDEYQDCGEIQHLIFTKCVENGLTGIAVGDINQAIYGFDNRFPQYLISLIGRDDFTHFELSKNHRCHPGISEYSLCLFGVSKKIPDEKRVFRISVSGDERQIAPAIDDRIERIKEKYGVTDNNQVAVLCRSNSTVSKMHEYMQTPHKIFEETVLDKDNSEWGRFFRDVLLSRYEANFSAADYAEQLFSQEFEPIKYRRALELSGEIFSRNPSDLYHVESEMIALAELVHPQKKDTIALDHLHHVLFDPALIRNYIPSLKSEVNLMTLHKSKGLEFNIVFHMDMYKWIIPNEYSSEEMQRQDLNLHYVGITRAKDVCYIMNGSRRYRAKNSDYISAQPSPFLCLAGLAERRIDVFWP